MLKVSGRGIWRRHSQKTGKEERREKVGWGEGPPVMGGQERMQETRRKERSQIKEQRAQTVGEKRRIKENINHKGSEIEQEINKNAWSWFIKRQQHQACNWEAWREPPGGLGTSRKRRLCLCKWYREGTGRCRAVAFHFKPASTIWGLSYMHVFLWSK